MLTHSFIHARTHVLIHSFSFCPHFSPFNSTTMNSLDVGDNGECSIFFYSPLHSLAKEWRTNWRKQLNKKRTRWRIQERKIVSIKDKWSKLMIIIWICISSSRSFVFLFAIPLMMCIIIGFWYTHTRTLQVYTPYLCTLKRANNIYTMFFNFLDRVCCQPPPPLAFMSLFWWALDFFKLTKDLLLIIRCLSLKRCTNEICERKNVILRGTNVQFKPSH